DRRPQLHLHRPAREVRLMRHITRRISPLGWVSLVVAMIAIAMSLLPRVFATDDPFTINVISRLKPPSAEAWFGTDELGRDLYSRTVHGIRLSLGSALGGVLLTALVGIPLGILAGYPRGWVDSVLMRIADMFIAFPSLIMAMAIVTVIGPGLTNAMIALALVWWPQYA